jgi:hypothetical protein
MRPVRITVALLFAATVGMLAPAAPAWAAPAATIQVSPSSITPGATVVVSGSVGPAPAGSACATSLMLLSRAFVHTDDFAGVPMVVAAVKPGGTFSTTTRIPRSTPPGTYTISGRCGGGNLGASATLTVRAATTATTTPAPAAPPATAPPVTQPQVAPPTGAGPGTQPATPAADPLAARWIVPGLVALAGGSLAALAVWLLYRRRPGAHGRSHLAS